MFLLIRCTLICYFHFAAPNEEDQRRKWRRRWRIETSHIENEKRRKRISCKTLCDSLDDVGGKDDYTDQKELGRHQYLLILHLIKRWAPDKKKHDGIVWLPNHRLERSLTFVISFHPSTTIRYCYNQCATTLLLVLLLFSTMDYRMRWLLILYSKSASQQLWQGQWRRSWPPRGC